VVAEEFSVGRWLNSWKALALGLAFIGPPNFLWRHVGGICSICAASVHASRNNQDRLFQSFAHSPRVDTSGLAWLRCAFAVTTTRALWIRQELTDAVKLPLAAK
jgi:hypothetical protein